MDFRTFLRTIVARWRLVAVAVVACLAGAVAITMAQTKTYEASATILVSVPGAVTVNDAYEATQAAQQRLSSYAEIAGGRTVAQRAIDQVGAQMSPEQLMGNTKVSYTPLSTLFKLTVADSNPQRAAELATAMAGQFAALVPVVDRSVDSSQVNPAAVGARSGDQQSPVVVKASVVEQPQVPESAVSPVPSRNVALGLLAGLFLGVALALARNATDRTVRGGDQLTASTGLPTLAELPLPKETAALRTTSRGTPADLVTNEAMRSLRTRLTGSSMVQARTFLVTAPVVGQGATTTALNLALSFTDVDESVLLIDGGRGPLADLLGVESELGFADVVADGQLIDDAVVFTAYPGLHTLVSTNTSHAPRRQFSVAALGAAIEKLCSNFDRVVIDGPPASVVADSATIAAAVDATVLVVRADSASLDDVDGALDKLRAAGGNVVGTVLTGVSVPRRAKAAMVAYRETLGETTLSDHSAVTA